MLFDAQFWAALFTIVAIDLVLAGDNAIVIGMAARNLPKNRQKQVILWGTLGAVVIRAAASMVVVWLLQIPGLMLTGGLLLLWIAYKLVASESDHKEVKAGSSAWAAIRTIVIADAAMGIDNVIAVGGAAHGDIVLVIAGLLISVPIVVWGSTLFISWMNKYPWIAYIGSGILAFTAAKMITDEPFMRTVFDAPLVKWVVIALIVIGVVAAGMRAVSLRKGIKREAPAASK